MRSEFVTTWVPPGLRTLANRALGAQIVYRGPYPDWRTAAAATASYAQGDILARVLAATRDVLEGRAEYEQDGVAMHSPPPPSHALSAVLMAGTIDGRLSVLDFGGGLGSHFLQWRRFVSRLPGFHWSVVEQANFVSAGQKLFAGVDAIDFHGSVAEARHHAPNAVLASGVLQYLPESLESLDELVDLGARAIVLDRIPFSGDGNEHILTQHVPPQLGVASYPLRLLSREAVHARLVSAYEAVIEVPTGDSPVAAGGKSRYWTSIWRRKG